jgi:hypothetical protein
MPGSISLDADEVSIQLQGDLADDTGAHEGVEDDGPRSRRGCDHVLNQSGGLFARVLALAMQHGLKVPNVRVRDVCRDAERPAEIFVLTAEIFVLTAEIFVLSRKLLYAKEFLKLGIVFASG